MKNLYSRIRINFDEILRCMVKILSVIFPLYWSVVFSGYFLVYFQSITKGILFALLMMIIIAGISTAYTLNICHKEIFRSTTNCALEVEYGDIFSSDAEIRVIPVNTCFDTIVDEKIISKKSLHGMLISQHLNKLSHIGFCQKLEEKLGSIESTEIAERVAGNVVRYPIGTVIEMEDGDITYYLLALTKLDEENHASCSVNDYYQAIISLMDYYDRHGQGRTMAVPTIGAGFSRLNMTEQVLLETLVSTIKMLQGYMRGNIKIVVHSKKKNRVSITNLR